MKFPLLCTVLAATLSGCATPQPMRHAAGYSPAVAEQAADTALTLVGRPYRFKGETPAGFDCSGLIRYSYRTAGMDVPHNTGALRKKSYAISSSEIRKGDLLFFNQLGKKYSHVGIAVSKDQFVHAPSSGKTVRQDSLEDPYWREHFLGARRL